MEERTTERRETAAAEERQDAFVEEQRRRAFVDRDLDDFRARYPDADPAKLERTEAFRRFCGTRLGREPLAELYADYLSLTEEARQSAAQRSEDRRSRSTGSGGDGGVSGLSAQQRSDLEEWNRAFPDMRMSAAEFLRR